jgi:hypothetical protein
MSGPGQELTPPRRSYSDAESAADLAAFYALKRSVVVWSLLVVVILGLAAARWVPNPALALVAGGVCGAINSWLTVRGSERLLEKRSVGSFVLSSFLRIGVFGIVPVAFVALGPWWSIAWYFAGFFLPLAMFALGASRAHERK